MILIKGSVIYNPAHTLSTYLLMCLSLSPRRHHTPNSGHIKQDLQQVRMWYLSVCLPFQDGVKLHTCDPKLHDVPSYSLSVRAWIAAPANACVISKLARKSPTQDVIAACTATWTDNVGPFSRTMEADHHRHCPVRQECQRSGRASHSGLTDAKWTNTNRARIHSLHLSLSP